jgi:hypothetical protein
MTKAIAITEDFRQNQKLRRTIFRLLIVALAVCSVSYFYLIGSITCNIVERRSFENKITSLNGQVNELDLIYLNMIKDLDKEYAVSNGFTDNEQNLFVSRDINHVAVR